MSLLASFDAAVLAFEREAEHAYRQWEIWAEEYDRFCKENYGYSYNGVYEPPNPDFVTAREWVVKAENARGEYRAYCLEKARDYCNPGPNDANMGSIRF